MQKIWICGAKGQIGQAINEIIDKLEFKVLDTDIDDLDITDTDEVLRFGEMNRPDIIINCAGLTNIEECENDISKAYKVNALGARNLSIIARKLEAKLVHISTDDVFDGKSDQPYNEFDQTRPQTAYGKSKLAGEQYVKEFTYKHFIIRSTWVYGLGNNFINDLLEKVNKGESLAIASDQFGSPTSAKELARFILHLIDTNEYGTYHATNKGVCSRYEFAHEILKLTGKEAQMKAVPTHLYDFSKVRPAYCVLDNFIMSMTPVYILKKGVYIMKNKKKLGLTTLIFIALIAGAITGIIINYCIPSNKIVDDFIVSGLFYVVGQGFIRLMRMLVVPLVFCSIVCGSMAVGDTKKLGSVGLKTMLFYLCTTALAVVVALCIANVINPGIGLDMSAIKITSKVTESTQATSVTETLLNIIPTNIFESLANGTMLQIILFALILGVILANMSDRVDIVKNFFSQFNDIMMEMTMAVMKLAPIGVFCLISKTFAEIGFDVFIPLLKYMFCVLLALGVQCFGVYMSMLKIFSGLNPIIFIKNFFPVMAFAFSTSTSNATIPMNIDTLAEKMGVSKKISSFTIPLGATINMDGTSIMQGVAVVFTAQAFGIHLSMMDYATVIGTATLASIGTAGVPSVGLITLTMVFNSVGLPVEGIALIMGIDRILDMTRTAVNITGDAVCTTVVASMNKAVDRDIYYGRK